MKGPNFEVGNPAPVFDPERYFLWDSDYPVAVAMFEMMAWFEKASSLDQTSRGCDTAYLKTPPRAARGCVRSILGSCLALRLMCQGDAKTPQR